MSSSKPKKMSFSKFRFPFPFRGRNEKQSVNSFVNETDVNKEYRDAFRTKSYIDICDKVQSHISLHDGPSSSSSSSSIRDHYIHECDILLEPQKETIANLAKTFDIHNLLLDFFDSNLEAWRINEKLLQAVHQANANHCRIKKVIKLAQRAPNKDQCNIIYEELSLYSSLVNPLSDFSLEKFPKIHKHHELLLKTLTTKHTRIKRKRKLIICLKKAGGCALVASYTVLVVALLVLACHGMVGIVACPGLLACSLGLNKKGNTAKKGLKTSELKRVCVQLDVAAKGIYTLIKDFDTMGWLVGKLHDEVEFGRMLACKCVANRKPDVFEEVMREFRVHESCFLEQLKELEDHIYLCLLNVKRSRKLLAEVIMTYSYKG